MSGLQPWRTDPEEPGAGSSSSSSAWRPPKPVQGGDHRGAQSANPSQPSVDAASRKSEVVVPKPYPIERIERAQLGKLQAMCTEFGPYYAMLREGVHPDQCKQILVNLLTNAAKHTMWCSKHTSTLKGLGFFSSACNSFGCVCF